MKKFIASLFLSVFATNVNAAELERGLFNITKAPVKKPAAPARPYQTYDQACNEAVKLNLVGLIACKGVSDEVLKKRYKEANDLGYSFCEVTESDDPTGQFKTGTTRFRFLTQGKPGLANIERADEPAVTSAPAAAPSYFIPYYGAPKCPTCR